MKWPWWLFLLTPCMAQVTFDVGPERVALNDYLKFSIAVEGKERNDVPQLPNGLPSQDFELVNGSPRTEFSMSIVNGNTTSVQTYTYYLRPLRKGTFTFPAQVAVVAGKSFRSNPTTVQVVEAERSFDSRKSRDPFEDLFGRRRRTNREPAEIFVEAQVSKTEFFIGEPINYLVNILRTPGVQISNNGSSMELPAFGDFWSEEVEGQADSRLVSREGKSLELLTVERRRLYANKTGTLTIEPVRFQLTVSVGGGFFADWQTVSRQSEPITLTIKPLPARGQPSGFDGLVGRFKIEGSLDRERVKAGESASLRVAVSGEGNFAALNELKLPGLGNDFEVFEGGAPEVEKRQGVTVGKSWVFALVPKREGTFTLELPQLSFFDPFQGEYKTTNPLSFPLEVLPGEGLGPALAQPGGAASLKTAQNLNYIKLGDLGEAAIPRLPTNPVILAQLAAGFILLDLLVYLVLFWRRKSQERRADLRPRFAMRNFRKRLARLKKDDLGDEAFYGGLARAMLEYFGDKWERSGKGLSMDRIETQFQKAGLAHEQLREVASCLEACEMARFAPTSPGSRDQLLQRSVAAIGTVEGVLS